MRSFPYVIACTLALLCACGEDEAAWPRAEEGLEAEAPGFIEEKGEDGAEVSCPRDEDEGAAQVAAHARKRGRRRGTPPVDLGTWAKRTAAKTSPLCHRGYCQCVALFHDYATRFLRKSFVSAKYAYQLYENAPAAQWAQLDAFATPQAGDVIVWKAYSGCGYGTGVAGHVGVVTRVQANGQLNVLHQNLSGDKSPRLTTETQDRNVAPSCLVGYLRPK